MATQVFSDAELERLRGFSEIDREQPTQAAVNGPPSDPERPEPELSWIGRRTERRRLREVRRERRRQMAKGAKDRKNQGKDRKKAKKGK